MTYSCSIASPLGELLALSDGACLIGLYLPVHAHGPELNPDWVPDPSRPPFGRLREQLGEYFAGQRREFDLPLAPAGTEFQQRVWQELLRIPYGETRSYGQLAASIGNREASRAVGLANGRNPISIIVPCHRVIGANGSLVGYGGGLPNKRALLDLERGQLSLSG